MQGHCLQETQSLQDFGVTSDTSLTLLDHNRCNSNWLAAVQSQPTHMNPLENISMQIAEQNILNENMMQNVSYSTRPVWDPGFLDSPVNSSTGSSQSACGPRNPSHTGFTSMAPEYDQILWRNNSGVEMAMKMNQGHFIFMEQGGMAFGNYNGVGSLEDVVTSMFKHV